MHQLLARWCSHKLEHPHSSHLSWMCLCLHKLEPEILRATGVQDDDAFLHQHVLNSYSEIRKKLMQNYECLRNEIETVVSEVDYMPSLT